jgi:hypothetical protein
MEIGEKMAEKTKFGLYVCASGQHHWTREQDADKCCNGYKEVIELSTCYPGGRHLTAEEQNNLICLDDMGFWHFWVKACRKCGAKLVWSDEGKMWLCPKSIEH